MLGKHISFNYITRLLQTQNSLFIFFFLVFLGPHLWHMVVPRLQVESEL